MRTHWSRPGLDQSARRRRITLNVAEKSRQWIRRQTQMTARIEYCGHEVMAGRQVIGQDIGWQHFGSRDADANALQLVPLLPFAGRSILERGEAAPAILNPAS